MGNKNIHYFTINKETSNNYYISYYYEEKSVARISCYYEEIEDILYVVFQNTTNIKYFILENTKALFEIGSYSQTIKLKSYETISYNMEDLFDFSDFGNLQVQTKRTYNTTYSPKELNFGGDNYQIFEVNSGILTTEESLNNWYQYIFSFTEAQERYARLFILPSVNIYVETCLYSCISCYEDYYICDNCKNESYAIIKGSSALCYPIKMRIEGYIYNSTTKMFEACYSTCQFCSKKSEVSSASEHNCISCKDGYAPSYVYQGNCYKINENEINLSKKVNSVSDENFSLVDSCTSYKINSTGECIEACPTTSVYYNFISKNINLTDITIDLINSDNYIETNIIPKYLFNGICYESCPLLTIPDEINNNCLCEYAYHTENDLSICYEEVDYCINSSYKYYLNDTKECISGKGCPSGYKQFNFQCYKNGCPSDTTTNSDKCISNYNYCYVNEYFQNICNNTKNDEYIYYFKETQQYLKSCDESLIYTTYETKTYLYNQICYLECPENTIIDETSNSCICSYCYYKFIDNNTLDCFENSVSCENKNYLYNNPDTNECYNSLDDCFEKGNNFYFNKYCYKEECPSKKISLSSTNETVQNYFKEELSLDNNLINKICICDAFNYNNIYWNKTEANEIVCLEICSEGYEPESLTHKCVENIQTTSTEINESTNLENSNTGTNDSTNTENSITEVNESTNLENSNTETNYSTNTENSITEVNESTNLENSNTETNDSTNT